MLYPPTKIYSATPSTGTMPGLSQPKPMMPPVMRPMPGMMQPQQPMQGGPGMGHMQQPGIMGMFHQGGMGGRSPFNTNRY